MKSMQRKNQKKGWGLNRPKPTRQSNFLGNTNGANMIEYHRTEIARCEAEIRDMEAGDLHHYRVAPDGRLGEETAYIFAVAWPSKLFHERSLAVISNEGCEGSRNSVVRN